jgi:2-amino-4-hydroxy-6-hydroxymethyldihydropteridine diphosphokinase
MIAQDGIQVLGVSSVYATPPWGDKNQDDFLNIVIEVDFEGTSRELLEKVLHIEIEMGRIRLRKWGPRLIDIDIIEFAGEVVDEESLQLPHPYYPNRVFVLAPFAELYPDWIPTGYQQTLTTLLSQMEDEGLKILPDVTL